METIRQWAFSVCAAMVACGLAQMLLPRAGMEKIFRTAVSVFFLCCLLSPVALRGQDFSVRWEEYSQADIDRRADRLTDETWRQAGAAAQGELQKIVEEKLVEMGINYRSVTININTNGQSGESPSVDILLGAVHNKDYEALRRDLSEELGMEVRMTFAREMEKEG